MKKFLYLLFGLLFIGLIPVTVSAESETIDVAYIDSVKDVMFEIYWDTEQPDILFLSPDGKEYNPANEADGTLTVYSGDTMYYIINGAANGQWKASYDKKTNAQVNISVKDYETKVIIQSFIAGELIGDHIQTKFLVKDSRESLYYQYRISAVVDKQGDERVLVEGGAYANQEVLQDVYLNELKSYNGYMLKLYVWSAENGTDISDFVYSTPFDYVSSYTSQTDHDYQIVIEPENYTADVIWEDLPWNAESSLFALFVNDGKEPLTYDSYGIYKEEVNLLYGTEATQLRFEFSYKMNNVYTEPLVKTVDILNAPTIELSKDEVINQSAITLSYAGFTGQMGLVTVNGNVAEAVLNGTGEFSIQLEDEWNEVCFTYDAGNGITWKWERSIFVDRQAPILRMLEDYTGIHTKDAEITIVGTAGDCVAVTIGETEITLDENGGFSNTVALVDGLNTIPIVAKDVAGNEANYTATITKAESDVVSTFADASKSDTVGGTQGEAAPILGGFLPIAISGGISIVLILYALIFWRKKKPLEHIQGDTPKKMESEEEEK